MITLSSTIWQDFAYFCSKYKKTNGTDALEVFVRTVEVFRLSFGHTRNYSALNHLALA